MSFVALGDTVQLTSFEVTLLDGLGTGIDDRTLNVTNVAVTRDASALTQGVDYNVQINSARDQYRLIPTTSIWQPGLYTIAIDNSAAGPLDLAGNPVEPIPPTSETRFTIDLDAPIVTAGGGGVFNDGGTVDVRGTILADNDSSGDNPDVAGNFTSGGFNLVGDVAAATGFSAATLNDLVGGNGQPVIDPLLGPLERNGGPTSTAVPDPTSPAIDAADNGAAPSVDQRGVERPKNGDNSGPPVADIGASERFFATLTGVKFRDEGQDGNRDVGRRVRTGVLGPSAAPRIRDHRGLDRTPGHLWRGHLGPAALAARTTANRCQRSASNPQLGRLPNAEDDLPGAEPVVVLSHAFWQDELGGVPTAAGSSIEIDGRPTQGPRCDACRLRLSGTGVRYLASAPTGSTEPLGPEQSLPQCDRSPRREQHDRTSSSLHRPADRSVGLGLSHFLQRVRVSDPCAEPASDGVGERTCTHVRASRRCGTAASAGLRQCCQRAIRPHHRQGSRNSDRPSAGCFPRPGSGRTARGICALVGDRRRSPPWPCPWPARHSFAPRGRIGCSATAPPTLDSRVLAFTLAVVVAATLLFGLWPALRITRDSDRRNGTRNRPSHAQTMSRHGQRTGLTRSALVVVQMTLAAVLLIGCGLVGRSCKRCWQWTSGMSPSRF